MHKITIKTGIVALILVAISLLIVVFIAWVLDAEKYYFKKRIFPVVLISDIHLGSEKCEWDQCGPEIEKAFQYVLDNTGDAMIITAGDNTDASAYSKDQVKASALRDGYKAKLLEMTRGREILWANGNHDRKTYVSEKEYYSYDKNNWRFIIIHTTNVIGEQYEWLAEQLKTDKNKIIVMHHPVFHQGSKKIIARYNKLVKLFSENNVRYVISGHWHADKYERGVDGVIYKALRGLTYRYKGDGGRYEVMELDYRMIDTENLNPWKKRFLIWINGLLKK